MSTTGDGARLDLASRDVVATMRGEAGRNPYDRGALALTCSDRLGTFETVPSMTPAAAATSVMLGAPGPGMRHPP